MYLLTSDSSLRHLCVLCVSAVNISDAGSPLRRGERRSCAEKTPLVEVVSNLQQKEMVTVRNVRISDRVTRIPGHLWSNLEHDARRKIPSAVLPGEPIGGKRDFLVQWLLDTELAACSIG